jgi:hypothetical protein
MLVFKEWWRKCEIVECRIAAALKEYLSPRAIVALIKAAPVLPDASALLGRLLGPSRFPSRIEDCALFREIH